MWGGNDGAVSLLQAEGEDGEDGDEEWKGSRLLTMAGIFDCWEPPAGGEALYTYTIITVDASKDLSFIHHRQVRRTAGSGAAFKHPSANVGREPCLLLISEPNVTTLPARFRSLPRAPSINPHLSTLRGTVGVELLSGWPGPADLPLCLSTWAMHACSASSIPQMIFPHVASERQRRATLPAPCLLTNLAFDALLCRTSAGARLASPVP